MSGSYIIKFLNPSYTKSPASVMCFIKNITKKPLEWHVSALSHVFPIRPQGGARWRKVLSSFNAVRRLHAPKHRQQPSNYTAATQQHDYDLPFFDFGH